MAILTPKLLWIAGEAEEIVNRILFSSSVFASNARDGIELARAEEFDVMLVSLPLVDGPGAEALLE